MGNDSEPGSSVEGVEVRKESFFLHNTASGWTLCVCVCIYVSL